MKHENLQLPGPWSRICEWCSITWLRRHTESNSGTVIEDLWREGRGTWKGVRGRGSQGAQNAGHGW
jgi:hypothetical protein